MIIATGTDIGKKRRENQDSFAISPVGEKAYAAVLCDGMGGAAGGKTASSLAAEHFIGFIKKNYRDGMDADECVSLITGAINEANAVVYSLSLKKSSLSGMGTTLVAALICEDRVHVANIGDSRLYEITDGNIKQITNDHTYVRYLLNIGEINIDEMATSPFRHMITRAVGTRETEEADFFELERKGQTLLLCSDGCYGSIPSALMASTVRSGSYAELENSVKELIDLANGRDGSDNITAIAIRL